ncbi:MAG TPA: copper resistance protein CopC [Actinomycetota bacterium]|nr:copper resistance protein CopC [Actinomycetota bacterium]
MKRRAAFVGAFVAVGLLWVSPAAYAHALLRSSDPAGGAQLAKSPSAVVLSFTEDPDPTLSIVHVIDQNGNNLEKGSPRAVPGHPDELTVDVGTLPNGVYTVNWRTVSKTDGHVTAGAFAFGVGVSPAGFHPKVPKTPPPSVLTVVSRWVFYVGLFLLLGVAFAVLFVSNDLARAPPLAHFGWFLALLGLLGLVEAQRRDAGVEIGHVFSTSIGHAFLVRLIPLVVTVIGVGLARRASTRRAGFAIILVGAAATVLGHVAEGHAATGSWRVGKILLQWAHVVAGGMWIGGLAAVLVGVRSLSPEARQRAVRRFSTFALYLIIVLSGAGVWRAFEEINSWHGLFATSYGQVVIAKASLLLVLIALGAVNRYSNVPRSGENPRGLFRTGSGELILAIAVLVLTGILSSVAPARAVQAGAPAQNVVVTGNDFGTTVKLQLTATPGTPGQNRFQLKVDDYNTGAPVQAQVSLRFSYLGPVQIGQSTLQLQESGGGMYTGSGTNLSLGGVWTVTAVIQRGTASVEVPLTVPTKSAQQVSVNPGPPGQPTVYTVGLSQGRSVQFYIDPGKPGLNEVHATYFDAKGLGLTGLSDYFVLETPPQGQPVGLTFRQLAEGHIVSDANLSSGAYRFDVWAKTKSGELLWSYFEQTIGK